MKQATQRWPTILMNWDLINVRDKLVRNSLAIFVPLRTIFGLASSTISLNSPKQQDGHVKKVEVGQEVA